MKAKVRISRFNHHKHSHILPGIVECYRDVFADSPWYEWKKCPKCGKNWGKKDESMITEMVCPDDGFSLEDFWSVERVIKDIITLGPETSFWYAWVGKKKHVIGFCWGYPINIKELQEELQIEIIPAVRAMFGGADRVIYQDEIGVATKFRNQRIAKRMYVARFLDFLETGLHVTLVRTREFPEPSVTYNWFTKKLGYRVVARYPGDDGRVILGNTNDRINELINT